MDLEIESLLFKQITKPPNHLTTKIINLWKNRYRVNVYIQFEEDNLTKKRIHCSYFCHYNPGELKIILEKNERIEQNGCKFAK